MSGIGSSPGAIILSTDTSSNLRGSTGNRQPGDEVKVQNSPVDIPENEPGSNSQKSVVSEEKVVPEIQHSIQHDADDVEGKEQVEFNNFEEFEDYIISSITETQV